MRIRTGSFSKMDSNLNLHPQRQPAPAKTAAEMFEPTNALITNGNEIMPETKPLHFKVVISAMMIWVSS